MRKGEFMIDSIDAIEDTKGNNGERGSLVITNLRMIWRSFKDSKTNLSECKHHLPCGLSLSVFRHRVQLHHEHCHQNCEFTPEGTSTGQLILHAMCFADYCESIRHCMFLQSSGKAASSSSSRILYRTAPDCSPQYRQCTGENVVRSGWASDLNLPRSYETSKLYRDLKLRGAIIKDKQLQILPQVLHFASTMTDQEYPITIIKCSTPSRW